LLSNFAFKFSLRHYTLDMALQLLPRPLPALRLDMFLALPLQPLPRLASAAGLDLPLQLLPLPLPASSCLILVGWCMLNPVEARVERDWFQSLKLKYDDLL
jgi:hypothetical protein